MSFRKYGGLNFAKSNNIVRNHLSNVDVLEITDHIGASGSQITCDSRLIVTDDIACTNLTAAYDITGTNLTIVEDTTLNMVQGFNGNPITFNSELLLEKDLVFAPKTSSEPYVKLVFSDGTVQDRLMLTTDTYWQPLPADTTGSLPDAIFFTKRVVAGVNPTSINDQMEAQNINFAVSGNAGILGDLHIGASGAGPTFVNNFSVKSDGDVETNGKLTVARDATFSSGLSVDGGATLSSELYVKRGVMFDNTLTVVKGATFSSDVYIKGALGVTGGVTLNNTLTVVKGATFSSDLYIKGALGVTGGVTLNNTLTVVKGATFSSDVYIQGALGVTGGVTLNNTLTVVKGATFSSDVYIQGALGVTGAVTMYKPLTMNGGGVYDRLINTCYVQYTDLGNAGNNTIVYQAGAGLLYDNNSTSGSHNFYVNDSVGAQSNPLSIYANGLTITGTLTLPSTALTYANTDLGYTTTSILNQNVNIISGAYQVLNITIPKAGVYALSGSMMLNVATTLTTQLRGCGFSDLTTFRNPQSAYSSTSMNLSTDTITLPVTTQPFTYYKNSSTTWVAAAATTIYFLGYVNFTAGSTKIILQATLTRIG